MSPFLTAREPSCVTRAGYLSVFRGCVSTMGARGFSCAVSGVGHADTVGLRPPKRSEEFPSAAREKKTLVPRVARERTEREREMDWRFSRSTFTAPNFPPSFPNHRKPS